MKARNEMGHIVRGVRSILGINIGEMADILGVVRETMSRVEKGDIKFAFKDVVGDALNYFQEKGIGVYENDEYHVILVPKK